MSNNSLKEIQNGLMWIVQDGQEFVLGCTQLALDQIGSVNSIDLPELKDEYNTDDWIGEIQGKEATLEFLAPFNLEIVEINAELLEQEGLLEDDPTGDAWILRVKRRD